MLRLLLLSLIALSCSDGGGGGEGPEVKYRAEVNGDTVLCLMDIEYLDGEGNRHWRNDVFSPWSQSFTGGDGDHLYLRVDVDCDEAVAMLYLDGSRVVRDTSFLRAEIEGVLHVDSSGNAWFEESDL